MGTPNSDLYKEAFETYALTGETPSVRTMYDLGFDYELLRDRVEAIKPQLPYMDSLAELESFPVLERSDGRSNDRSFAWSELVKDASLVGARCIRFDEETDGFNEGFNRQKYRTPIFRAMRRVGDASMSSSSLEIFLQREGGWVIYTGAMLYKPEPAISVFETTEEAFDMLLGLQSAGHAISSRRYRSLNFHARPGEIGYGHDSVLAIGFALMLHLRYLLERSIEAKERRLATQRDLLRSFQATESRNGLILDTFL